MNCPKCGSKKVIGYVFATVYVLIDVNKKQIKGVQLDDDRITGAINDGCYEEYLCNDCGHTWNK